MQITPIGVRVLLKSYYVANKLDVVHNRISDYQLHKRINECSVFYNHEVPIIAICWMLLLEYQRVEYKEISRLSPTNNRRDAFAILNRPRFRKVLGNDFVKCYLSMVDITTGVHYSIDYGPGVGVQNVAIDSVDDGDGGLVIATRLLDKIGCNIVVTEKWSAPSNMQYVHSIRYYLMQYDIKYVLTNYSCTWLDPRWNRELYR